MSDATIPSITVDPTPGTAPARVARAGSSLAAPIVVSDATKAAFDRDGFVVLRDVLDPVELVHWQTIISAVAKRENTETRPLAERDSYGQAFLQTTNLWQRDDVVHGLVFSRCLASIARQLLAVEAVRLYHDQALFKEAGGGHTAWHVDQYYWPLASDRTVTAWLPLVPVTAAMGPLAFASGSQHQGPEVAVRISDESEATIAQVVAEAGYAQHEQPFALGDVSFHLGWTMHRAGANHSATERAVMTMIYMDADMRMLPPHSEAHRSDQQWLPGIEPGQICASPLNPVIPSN